MKDWVTSLSTTIEHTFEMHPPALFLCKELLSLTVDFFCEMSSMMQILYRELMVKTFGSDHPGKESMAICCLLEDRVDPCQNYFSGIAEGACWD